MAPAPPSWTGAGTAFSRGTVKVTAAYLLSHAQVERTRRSGLRLCWKKDGEMSHKETALLFAFLDALCPQDTHAPQAPWSPSPALQGSTRRNLDGVSARCAPLGSETQSSGLGSCLSGLGLLTYPSSLGPEELRHITGSSGPVASCSSTLQSPSAATQGLHGYGFRPGLRGHSQLPIQCSFPPTSD